MMSIKYELRKLLYRIRERLCRDIVRDELIDALSPDFGYEWQKPDGALYRAYMQGREHERQFAMNKKRIGE